MGPFLVLLGMLLLSLMLLDSCTTGGSESDNIPPGEAVLPANLVLDIEWTGADSYNPFGDGSGEVVFTATADQAERYSYRIDNGDERESTDGSLVYTFEQEGTLSHNIRVTAYSATADSVSTSQEITVYRSNDEFPTLVWADEFEYSGSPQTEKWHHQVIPILGNSWANGEVQHYTDRIDNSQVDNGTLKIVARKEEYTFENTTKSYTSARLNSKFAFQYGRVEVRAKLPEEAGTWPAIWTLGANINELGNYFGDQYGSVGWPRCGEIDILEQRGGDKSTTIAYFHWFDTDTNGYQSTGNNFFSLPTATDEFHVYSLRWNGDTLRVFVDELLVYELENTPSRPYDDPHYLLLNIAMGGTLGGEIPVDFAQATLEVDYVRVYQ